MGKAFRPKKSGFLRWIVFAVIGCLMFVYLLIAYRYLSVANTDPEPPDEREVPTGLLDLSLRGFHLFTRCIDFHCERECVEGVTCCADVMFRALVIVESILRKYKIVHYACFGTALGAVRNRDIIWWTSDVDICGPNIVLPAEAIRDLYGAGLLYFLTSPPREQADRAKICLTPGAFKSGIVPLSAKLPGNMKGKTSRIPYIDLYQDEETQELEVYIYPGPVDWEEREFLHEDQSLIGQLERLQVLFSNGALTAEEYGLVKSQILKGESISTSPPSPLPPTAAPRNVSYLYWLNQRTCMTEKAVIYPLKVGKIRDLEVFLPRNVTNYLHQWYGADYMKEQVLEPQECMFTRSE